MMKYLEPPETFAQCLVRLRGRRNIQQKSLALAAGMDQSYVAGLESGRRPPPRDKQIQRLSLALNATEAETAQLISAKAVTKLNALLCKTGPNSAVPLARLLATVASMSTQDVFTLDRIAEVLRSAAQQGAGGADM